MRLSELQVADFGDLLGTFMVGLVRARQLADEATAAVAEQYKRHPLLEGMTVARVRIPELTIDAPILIRQEDPGEAAVPEAPAVVASKTSRAVTDAARQAGVKLPASLMRSFRAQLASELTRMKPIGAVGVASAGRASASGQESPLTREGVARCADEVLVGVLRAHKIEGLTEDVIRFVAGAARARAGDVAEKVAGRLPTVAASFITEEVKEEAAAANVTRVRVTFKEEGLEWTTIVHEDGSAKRRLVPE